MKKIYVCGPTVYASPHVGNMRPLITFDFIIKAYAFLGEEVKYVHNITDIDDKIIAAAKTQAMTEHEIATTYLLEYKQLMRDINVSEPSHMPLVTKNIPTIIEFIDNLIQQKHAYAKNGSVYFDVMSIPNYGKLANRTGEQKISSSNLDMQNNNDFALWKKTSEGINFDSPWGYGRPGWHTECAALIKKYFSGQTIDIHGGGIDLLFPHHENEQAQFFALMGEDITHEWRHIGKVQLDGLKMSKSLGNIVPATNFINMHGSDTLRYIFLTTSYSAPINFTPVLISQAKDQVSKWKKAFTLAQLENGAATGSSEVVDIAQLVTSFDFSASLVKIHKCYKDFVKLNSNKHASIFISVMQLLGFAFSLSVVDESTKRMYHEWVELRKVSNFKQADVLRKKLQKQGVF